MLRLSLTLAFALLQTDSAHAETLLLTNGTEVKGTLISTEADHYLVAQENGSVKVPRAEVTEVRPDLYVLLKDGTVLSGNVKDVSATLIVLENAQGQRQIDRALVVKLSTAPVNIDPPQQPVPEQQPPQISTATQAGTVAISSAAPVLAAAPAASQTVAAPPPQATPPQPAADPAPPTQAQATPAAAETAAQTEAQPSPRQRRNRRTRRQDPKPAEDNSLKPRLWHFSAQLGAWRPGLKLTSPHADNETISVNRMGILFGGRLMRELSNKDWQLGVDISMLSLTSKDYGTTANNVKISGERWSLLALAAYHAATMGKYDLYALGGAGLAKTSVNYNVTPNSGSSSSGYSIAESRLQLAAGLELQTNLDGTLAGLSLMLYNAGTTNSELNGSSSLTASLGARLIWGF
ncbi:MAG TPA: hypothetical protein PLL10_04020 [Elusimicrobiales bacterium]|nr:hypothetical protein [Elusimicrobiales bacterium]